MARVPTKLKLVQIIREMLAADAVERAHHAATNQRKHTLYRIGVNVRPRLHVLTPLVPNSMMAAFKLAAQLCVEIRFVCNNAAGQISVFCDELPDTVSGQTLQCVKANVSTTLYHTNNRIFVAATSRLRIARIARFAAHV